MTQLGIDFSPRPRGCAPDDEARLDRLLDRVRRLMSDGEWRTLPQISEATSGMEASVSARLRELRNRDGLTVERRLISRGLYAYRVVPR